MDETSFLKFNRLHHEPLDSLQNILKIYMSARTIVAFRDIL